MMYIGLTDDPELCRQEHDNPSDWQQKQFHTEEDARTWIGRCLNVADSKGNPGGTFWKYGYWYRISPYTKQS